MERNLHRQQERGKRKAGYKKPAIPYFVRRILLSWLIFLIIGGLIGGAIGHVATKKKYRRERDSCKRQNTGHGTAVLSPLKLLWIGTEVVNLPRLIAPYRKNYRNSPSIFLRDIT